MSTPDDQNADRGQVVPPWKRGEKSTSTGLTAGQMAASASADDARPTGPAPRGVVSGQRPAPTSGPIPTVGPPAQPASAPVPPKPADKPAFVESETRNIPRDDLAKKDQLPDLDAIHQVDVSKEGKAAAARAQSQTIPSRAIGVPLRAAVQIRRVDPWSVFKVSGVLSIAGFFIWMIAVAVLYGVLAGMGVWDQINSSFGTLVDSQGTSSGSDLIGAGMVFGFSAGFGVVAAILITGIATISAYIYNVCADMVGGVEVTLADLD
ncbi:hypothetical protein nbrc107696_10730 [Gordonia spumicola]|uniref:DUF3566 domain-containing protein n=1 Tax=Gordonia spumicola TaxID=589161 RepID=A0A7I9V5U4_9ACTN|nr:DUF3566 domain-containing protein [Gordonia spumicola]GEE00627.1 hypothetical protein nbrc107696_10730 [Gordonia spumicola]